MDGILKTEPESRVLVIEDDASQLHTLTDILADEGYEVVGCRQASEALNHLEDGDFGVAVLDLRLPDLVDEEVLDRMAEYTSRTRLVIHTGYGSYETAKAALNAGAFAYVEKGGDPEQLLRQVNRASRACLRLQVEELEQLVAERTCELLKANQSLKAEVEARARAEQSLRESEVKFHSVFNQAYQFAGVVALDGTLMAANRNALAFIEATEDDVVGKPFWQTPWWSHSEKLQQWLRGVIAGTARQHAVRRMVTHLATDGSTHYFDFSLTPVWDERGSPAYLVAESRDVTDQRLAQLALQKSEEKYRRIVETAMEGIWVIDARAVTTYANKKLAEMLGYSDPNELIGRSLFDFMDGESRSQAIENIAERMKGISKQHDFCFRRKDGSDLWAIVNTYPVFAPDGSYEGALAMILDITARRAAQKRLKQHQVEMAHVWRINTLGEMTTGIVHEISQPLCAIQSFASGYRLLLKRGDADLGAIEDVLEKITLQAGRANETIKRIRGLSKRQAPSYSTISINSLIEDVLEMLSSEIRDGDVKIVKTFDPDIPTLFASHIEIEEVVMNLVRNAIQAMTEVETQNPRLTMKTSMDRDGVVEVAVSDNGKGLSDDCVHRVFDSFYTTKAEGLGIGLSLSRSIVESHHGKIWAESNADGGATFKFTLPLNKCDDNSSRKRSYVKRQS